jgi:hypothetical protein
MATLTELHQAVQKVLASRRLGQPVFVRYLVQGLENAESIFPRLTRISAIVRAWLGQPLERLHALGSTSSGQVALTLQFRDGVTALIIFAQSQPRGAGVDILVIGNHGTLNYDAVSAVSWEESPAAEAPVDPLLYEAIEQSLLSGQPVALSEEARA